MTFEEELTRLINSHSADSSYNSPDFILAQYIEGCLAAYARATKARDLWYGGTGVAVLADCAYCGHDKRDHNSDGHCIRDHMGTGPNPCPCLEFEPEAEDPRP